MTDSIEPLYMPDGEARLWQALMVMAQELSVTRDRIDLLERALAAKHVLADGELETLPLDGDALAERAAARLALVQRLIKPLRES